MMKLKFLKPFSILFVLALLATACNNDDDGGVDEGQSSGDYFPLALNNMWTYSYTAGDDMVVDLSTTLEYNTNTYFITQSVNPIDGSDMTQGFRKSGATYYGYNGEMFLDYEVATATISPTEFIFFKDDMEEGDSLTSDVSSSTVVTSDFVPDYTTTTDFTFTSTLVERGATLVVNNVTYSDVIEMNLLVNATIMGQDYEQELTYYFAKDVGPIQLESNIGTYSLVSYTLN